ncbi:MAG: ATP-binding protein [Candidatus Nanopelagicales bacterium]
MANLLLGGPVDPGTHSRTDGTASLPPEELTTHAVIVGMTGSGKTGLGVVLIEEVLRSGIPALLIDPKGDLTNLALTFPQLSPQEFLPWIDEAAAGKAGQDADGFAAAQADSWTTGLAGWDLGPAQVAALHDAADVTIYTPAADHGVGLNIIGTLEVPADMADPQAVQEEIDAYVSSLLNLLGLESDPLSSREHILLTNIINDSWTHGRDLDLSTLVASVQTPPIRKIGVLELDSYYPPGDRQKLALKLNGLLASPAFQAWLGGQRIDIAEMLRTADGRPRCAVITTSHLSDEQRQSVTSVLLAKLISWMRRQSGTSDLRALLYMDEVAGYLPPTGNPPTKAPLMLLLKQARAFGLGVVLSTQNPVDLDYKAPSNAGTWMIGRLQTEQDKARLLSGLTSAAGTIDASAVSATISGLGKREFVLKRASRDAVEVFTTRWAMSYLRGPMTREQISSLRGATAPTRSAPATTTDARDDAARGPDARGTSMAPTTVADDETTVAPQIAAGVRQCYLDPAASWSKAVGAVPGARLAPGVVARVNLHFDDRKAAISADQEYETVLYPLVAAPLGQDFRPVDYDDRDLLADPPANAVFKFPPGEVKNKSWWTALRRDLTAELTRTQVLGLPANAPLKLYGRLGETATAFALRAQGAAADEADTEIASLRQKYERKFLALQRRVETAEQAVTRQESARNAALTQEMVDGLMGGLFGGRKTSVSASVRRGTAAANRVANAQDKVDELSRGLADLEAELAAETRAIREKWQALAAELSTCPVTLAKADVKVTDLALVWIPVGPT